MPDTERSLLRRPPAVARLEARLGRALPVHPNLLSAAKLVVATPAMGLALGVFPGTSPSLVLSLAVFALFGVLDYLDGVVARERDLETGLGRVLDRATDYPMLLLLGLSCADVIPPAVLGLKLGLDLLLLGLYAAGRGSTQNRVRTTLTYATLLALLFLGHGWAPRLVTPGAVTGLVAVNVGFGAIVALYNLRILRGRHLADLLSLANLGTGVASMLFASQGHPLFSVVMLLCGAAFDGLDGAAARRFGGSRFGVLADDVADAVSYGLAPGFALGVTLGGASGWLLGVAFAAFVVTRLIHFTRTKDATEPATFRGAPSTVGALIALGAVTLFADDPLLVGALVGAACVLMTSFGSRFAHARRLRAATPAALPLGVGALMVLAGAFLLSGPLGPVALLLAGALAYGFLPTARTLLAS